MVSRAPRRFSIARYLLLVALQSAALVLLVRWLLPATWARQVGAGPLRFAVAFVAAHLFLSFFEWAFHRYALHGILAPRLAPLARAHRNHHRLTPIRLRPGAPGSDRFVLNEYPITRAEQFHDSAFPVYALAAFWALFAPLWIVAQLLLPGWPVLLAGFSAVVCSLALYEVLHAIEHYPYEWWKRATEHPRFGGLWRRVYGHHHMHHANVGCNEAISGFFGLPVPDWCLGTHHQPRELLLADRRATARDFAVRPPPRWVAAIDRWARAREAASLRVEGAPRRESAPEPRPAGPEGPGAPRLTRASRPPARAPVSGNTPG